jgi:hypothetical protein
MDCRERITTLGRSDAAGIVQGSELGWSPVAQFAASGADLARIHGRTRERRQEFAHGEHGGRLTRSCPLSSKRELDERCDG